MGQGQDVAAGEWLVLLDEAMRCVRECPRAVELIVCDVVMPGAS